MSTIKISQLPTLTQLNSNTANTLFVGVDVPSDTTGKFTATTLAAGLYSNNALVVGINPILLTNTVAQFSGTDTNYIQVNLQNFSNTGAGDMVITTDVGTDTSGFIDLGINNSQWNPVLYGQTSQFALDGYLIVDGPASNATGNLVIGTANPGTNLVFAVGGQYANNISAKMTANGLVLNTQSYLTFADGTVQTTNAATYAYSQAAFAFANTINSQQTAINATQNTSITAAFAQANASFTAANSAGAYANSAFTAANTINSQQTAINATQNTSIASSFTQANSAFTTANSAGAYANSAFTAANTAASNTANLAANLAGIQLTQNTSITAAFAQANAAFITANNALANTTGTLSGSLTITGNVSANYVLISNQVDFVSGNGTILTSNGSNNNKNLNLTAGSDVGGYPGGTITITSGSSSAIGGTGGNINLIPGTGNVTNGSVVVAGNLSVSGNLTINGANTAFNSNIVTYGAMTTTGNVVTTGNLTATGPVTFNGNFINNGATTNNGNTINNGNLTTTGNVVSVGTLTANGQSIFNGNTQFNGSVSITNNLNANTVFTINVPAQTLTMNGTVTIQNSNFPSTTSGVRIDGSNNAIAQQTTAAGTMLQISGLDGGYATRMIIDNYSLGNANAYPLLAGRAARGNSANPTAVQSGDILMRWGGNGYSNTFALSGGATIDYLAAENYTDSSKGSTITFNTTQTGTNVRTQSASINTSLFAISSNTTTANTVVANTFVMSSYTANSMVTQLSSKSTAVTANGISGQITMNNAKLNHQTGVTFTVNNSYVQHVYDIPIIAIQNPVTAGLYTVTVGAVRVGSFDIFVYNNGAGAPQDASDAIVLNWALLRVGN